MLDKVADILNRNLPESGKVGVAVSGGSDSMSLIDCVVRYGLIDKDRIVVINVEHGIRGEESLRDSFFVKEYCERNGLRLIRESADIPSRAKQSGRSIETEARIFRKSVFDRLVKSEVRAILLAHNLNDRTETVLMHIFRGSGLKGLVGMTEHDGYIIRPLINCDKSEILAYIRENDVPYVEDSTNADDAYSRNFLRLKVLPLLRERYGGLDRAIANLSDIAALTVSPQCVEKDGDSAVIKEGDLSGGTVIFALEKVGLAADYTKKHVDSVLALKEKPTGTGVDLPHGFRAERESGGVRVFRKTERRETEIPFCIGKTVVGDRTVEITRTQSEADKTGTVLDVDALPDGAVIRTRRDGDIFTPFGGGSKPLSDWLIDKKIPRYKRETLLYVAAGSEIYAVVGVCTGEKAKITESTKNAVRVAVFEG